MGTEWWKMPEDTEAEVMDKILEIVHDISTDWNNPEDRCRNISRLMRIFKTMKEE